MAIAMTGHDIESDANSVFECVRNGGVAVIHLDVGYAVLARTADAVRRIYAAKGRSFDKPTGIVGSGQFQDEVHILSDQAKLMIDSLTNKHNLPVAVIAPYRKTHSLLQRMDPFVLANAVKSETLNILLNAGTLRAAIADLTVQSGELFVGSSANTSLKGSRYRVCDIEPEIINIADVVIDYGPSQYANDLGVSSTMINFSNFKVQRAGVCYAEISAVLMNEFGVELQLV
jgi:tRNA A37 threonylcarbamoyladenosine synthetase subunit TsaC/SUA5/YrdC